MKMKVGILIAVRLNSSRFPLKALSPLYSNNSRSLTLIEVQLERLLNSKYSENIVVCTSTSPCNEPLVQICKGYDVNLFRD